MTTVARTALLPILVSCVGYFSFNITDALVKYLGNGYHFSQTVVFSCLSIIICMIVYGIVTDGKEAFKIRNKKLVWLRAVLSVVSTAGNVYIMPHIALTTIYTIAFTSPFMIAVLSALVLKEKLIPRQLAAIGVGFAVILFIFQPGAGLLNIYALLALASAFSYSCCMIIMRKLGPQESLSMIIISGAICTIAAMLPVLPGHYIAPAATDMALFFLIGLMGAGGLFGMNYAYQRAASAAGIAPYHYTQIVYGALIGYFVFAEVPSMRVMIGAAVIIAAGLTLIYAETKAARKNKKVIELPETTIGN